MSNQDHTKAEQGAIDAPVLGAFLAAHPTIPVYTQSHPQFEEHWQYFNRSVVIVPLAIARPRNIAEVSAVVKYFTVHNVPMSIRSSGRDTFGRHMISDGVVVDIRELADVSVSPDRTYCTVGPGISGGRLLEFLDKEGLITPVGWDSGPSYIGWSVGGGYGWCSGQYGLGVDQILGAKLVTPNGEVVDTEDDEELLWAIRGAGNGSFGVIVELRTKVYERPKMLLGNIIFPFAEAKRVLSGYDALCSSDLPAEVCTEMMIAGGEAVDKSAIVVIFSWVLNESNLQQALDYKQKILELGTVIMDTVSESTPWQFLSARGEIPLGYKFHRSASVASFSPEVIDCFLKNPAPPGQNVILIHQSHGKAIEPNPNAVFSNRIRHFMMGFHVSIRLDDPEAEQKKEVLSKWPVDLNDDIRARKLALDQGYWSYNHPDDADALHYFGLESTERLRQLKKKYNPDNVFPQAYPVL